MSDMYLGSQAPMYQNVHIRVRDEKTGRVRLERTAKNRITKLMLWGIARFLSGEFNDSTPDKIYEVIPRYLALGSNKPKAGDNSSITTSVSVNDTRLLNEYTVLTSTGSTEPVKRISIQGRQHSKLTTHFSDPFIKLSLSTYVSSAQFDGVEIGEAGLFSKETSNNCLARVVFPTFKKEKGEVIDIQWDITLLSYGTTKYAESVSIDGPNKITLGLDYTPYHIVTEHLGLYRLKNDNRYLYNRSGNPIFELSNNLLTFVGDSTDIEEWKEWVTATCSSYTVNEICSHLTSGCVFYPNDDQVYYKTTETPTIFYFDDEKRIKDENTLLADNEYNLLHDVEDYQLVVKEAAKTIIAQEMLISYIGVTESEYDKTYTGATLRATASPKDYIVEYSNDSLKYKVIDNQFYIRESSSSNKYNPCDAYLYSNTIINGDGELLPYTYDAESGKIYEVTLKTSKTSNTSAFLRKLSVNGNKIFQIYKINNGVSINYTGYWIDWDVDKEVYYGENDLLYHVSNDNYFVIGDTYQLKASILPTDTTDTSLTWTCVNQLITKLSTHGAVQAWNVGETMAIVTTSNDLKARIIIEVVKSSTMHAVDDITLEPNSLNIQVTEPDTTRHIVTAVVTPPFATYHTVEWKLDNSAEQLCSIIALGNNKVAVTKPTGNIGRGYLIATTQDGKSAKCLITTQYESSDVDDCRDPCHDDQQI